MEIIAVGNAHVARMPQRLDSMTSKEAEAALAGRLDEGVQALVCDFAQTEYMSSAGLRVLLATAKRLQKSGGRMVLCGVGDFVREVLETSGFIKLFSIFPTETEALAEA